MRVAVTGLAQPLADAVAAAFVDAGHELAEPADVAIVGVDVPTGTDLHRLPQPDWDSAVALARGAFLELQRVARRMSERGAGGSVLVVVPAHALRSSRGCGLAAVVGSFLTTAAQVAAVELGAKGIRVNVLALGPLEGDVADRTADGVPLGRLARPADLGAACVMLAGSGAAYVTGSIVTVDGGYTITKAVGGSPFADA